MLYAAVVCLLIALVAALFGFGIVASAAVGFAKIIFWIFLVLFILSLLFGRFRGPGTW